jgi:chemotaxis protein CheD
MGEDTVTVKMAEMELVDDGRSLKTILGSCVGVILRDPERRISGLAHIMLPERRRDDTATGKYADSAVPALYERVLSSGARHAALQALLIGWAQMFAMGNAKIAAIGDLNIEAARKALKEIRVPIVYEETGGRAGRAVLFENATGKVTVKTLQSMSGKGESK